MNSSFSSSELVVWYPIATILDWKLAREKTVPSMTTQLEHFTRTALFVMLNFHFAGTARDLKILLNFYQVKN